MAVYDPEKITFFAKTDARGQHTPFGIKAKDRSKHMYIIGKTGMGKSTLLENMAIQDIQSGEGIAFIDPHGSTAEKLLEYVPEERVKDVLYFAPFDMDYPVSFNVMEDVGADKRHLVVSGLMSTFKKIWVDAWSARMEYILSNTLLALLEYPGSTLLGVNRMLSDKDYRDMIVENVKDPSVKSFWVDEFAKYNERYMQEAGDAIKNKVGQFTANPLIRNIIGQPKSSFDLREVMDKQKILIMNLSKGLVGETNANLLGSMLITRIYLSAMSRANLNADALGKMPNFYFYVDEFQSFANETFANILSEARKYKLNLTIAHQYIEQMEEEVRDAVFGNVGTTIAFRVGPLDAEFLEAIFTPQFTAVDLVNLGFAQVYLSLMIDGIGSKPFSAVTLPPIEQSHISYKDQIIAASRAQYAKPRTDVETVVHAWHEPVPKKPGADKPKKPAVGVAAKKPVSGPIKRDADTEAAVRTNGEPKSEHVQARPAQNGDNGQRPAAVRAPHLDDLRTVLRTIAGTGPQSGTSDMPKGNQEARGETAKLAQKQPHLKYSSSAGDLKSALASVLALAGKAEGEPKKAPEKELEKKPGEKSEHASGGTQMAPASPPEPPSSNPPVAASSGPSLKEVERMLRVTGNDNPPVRL